MQSVNTTSGPQPERGSESREVREVQFLVERFCPKSRTPVDLVISEPFPVWVDYNDRQHNMECGGVSYGVTPAGIRAFAAAGFEPIPDSRTPSCCEHMGRLIE